MKKPWRKLYVATPNDEKLRLMITKYGHECGWIWPCLIAKADDDGIVNMDREDLAYLCIVDENRLNELLSVFERKRFIELYGDEIIITNWHEYQDAESESAPRVRAWREKKRAEASAEEAPQSSVTVTLPKPELKQQDIDIDIEEEKEKEIEYKTEAPVFSLSDELNPGRIDGTTRIEQARNTWNDKNLKPPCRFTPINFKPDRLVECLSTIKAYTDEEITRAIENYHGISRSAKHELTPRYGSFEGFMAAGVAKYADDADPWERCLKDRSSPEIIGHQVRAAMEDRKKINPAPEKCPHCGCTVRHTTDSAGCKCGAMWELRGTAWKEVIPEAV